MKKNYIKPELELIDLNIDDVIMDDIIDTSATEGDGGLWDDEE